jgi:hypothetical protein
VLLRPSDEDGEQPLQLAVRVGMCPLSLSELRALGRYLIAEADKLKGARRRMSGAAPSPSGGGALLSEIVGAQRSERLEGFRTSRPAGVRGLGHPPTCL